MALTFMAYCPTCKKRVMAMPLQSREDLIAALDNAIDVPVMHADMDSEHQWQLINSEKENLRKTIAEGLL